MTYYAVKVGRKKGIYEDWESCNIQINKFRHAQFKKFNNIEDANNYINEIENVMETKISEPSIDKQITYIYYHNFPGFIRPKFNKQKWRKYYYLFTDGSHRNKSDLQFSSGYSVYTFSSDISNISKRNNNTNNYCELSAIRDALKLILNINDRDNKEGDLFREYLIVSDSQYCLRSISQYLFNWIINGWKRSDKKSAKEIHHKEVWFEIYRLLRKLNRKNISTGFLHVKSHKKKPNNMNSFNFLLWYGNRCADRLALGKTLPSHPLGFVPVN